MRFKIETLVGAFILLAIAVFFYMSFQLGSFRLDLARYATYSIGFKDVSGLVQKADVKIAGVKVGWVDTVVLVPEGTHAEVTVKILKDYNLYKNAYAVVRQEGMLGAKFLEIVPGEPAAGRILSGGSLPYQIRQFVGMDEIFYTFQKIAQQVEQLGASLKETSDETRTLLQNLKKRLAPLDTLLSSCTQAAQAGSESVQATAQAVKDAALKLSETLQSAQGPLQNIEELTSQVKAGGGSLGKLLADDQLYRDIRGTSDYAQRCIARLRRCAVMVDNHLEVLPNSFNDHKNTNLKWYFDTYLWPCPTIFGKVGFTYGHQGFAKHSLNACNNRCFNSVHERRDGFRLNLQFGKYFHPYGALRLGIFEGTFGVGIDWWMPFEKWWWLSTFEAFDFKGHNRFIGDRRPHLKWLNRIFFNENIYLTFGADDFISKCNKSAFIGLGAYFSFPGLPFACAS